jgi:NADPH-dependent glutamate synthase beta subunit-like oxidoreductase
MGVRVVLPQVAQWKAQVKCQAGCPVGTDAGRYVQLAADDRIEEAYLVARSPNPFASVCGRVCAAPCEDVCRRGSIDAPVAIRALKRHLTEQYGVESPRPDTQQQLFETPDGDGPANGNAHANGNGQANGNGHANGNGSRAALVEGNQFTGHLPLALHRRPPEKRPAVPRRIAIVGAGPAGLAAAHDLALLGYAVTIFEAAEEPGGMMRYGIPEYRLPRALLRAEIDRIRALGVTLHLNTPLTPAFGLRELRASGFDAVFLSVGVSRGRDLQAPGVELDGVVKAVDYLLNVNRGYKLDLGRRVVVIGGGFVAFDAARTALRLAHETGLDPQEVERLAAAADARVKEAFDSARAAVRGGAAEVTIVSLESLEEMPVLRTTQGHEEFEEAKREGIRFVTRRGPVRFVSSPEPPNSANRAAAADLKVRTTADRLGAVELRAVTSVFDANGRFAPTYDDADVLTIEADACVLAIGQRADLSFLSEADGIELTPSGVIKVDPVTLATSAKGVYAGGDVAFGPRNLIEAVANGKRAARSIHEELTGDGARIETTLEIEELPIDRYRMLTGFEHFDREAPPTIPIDRRTGVAEVEIGFDVEEARRQAARCLVCHVQTIYDPEACVLCNRCVDVCPEYCLAIVPFDQIDVDDATRAALTERAEGGGLPLAAMVKDDERCIRCGLCAIRCPTGAMTMERFTITERWTS